MSRATHKDWTYVRHHSGKRSLWVEYTRPTSTGDIRADLFDARQQSVPGHLTIMNADARGIEIGLPHVSAGMFMLTIQDGERAIRRRIMLQ